MKRLRILSVSFDQVISAADQADFSKMPRH